MRLDLAAGGDHVSDAGCGGDSVFMGSATRRVPAHVYPLLRFAPNLPTKDFCPARRGGAGVHGMEAVAGPPADASLSANGSVCGVPVRLLHGVPRRDRPEAAASEVSHLVLCENFAGRGTGRAVRRIGGSQSVQCVLRIPDWTGSFYRTGDGSAVAAIAAPAQSPR